jgi:hypothetical protein
VRTVALYLAACALAAAAPLVPHVRSDEARPGPALSFPTRFEGRPLRELPLGLRERRFTEGFPGRVGRFTDGERQLIVRLVVQATRRLHPAADCLRAAGFGLTPGPARRGPDGSVWGCSLAVREGERLSVCEQIGDSTGRTWSDPSSWYWAALLGRTTGPWISLTVAERP